MSNIFSDVNLIRTDGTPSSPPSVPTALLFSSSWCPDCVPFVARLAAMYEEVNEDEKKFEVVFVSSDRSSDSMSSYMSSKHPSWLAVSYDDPKRDGFKRMFGCAAGSEASKVGVNPRKYGIPALVILGADGEVVKESGVKEVEEFQGGDELPESWTA